MAGLVTRRRSIAGVGPFYDVESNWTYDKLGRVTSQAVKKGPTLTQVTKQDVAYFGNDDPKSLDHYLGATKHRLFSFGYDKRHQLTSVFESVLPKAFMATYTYGTAGRFATALESSMSPQSEVTARDVTYLYAASDPERLTALKKNGGTTNLAEYTYDEPGNQLTRYYPGTRQRWEYVYDGKNQLRRVAKKINNNVTGSEEYWYDDAGARTHVVKRNASGAVTETIAFLAGTEAHFDSAGTTTRVFSHVALGTTAIRLDRSTDGPSTVEYQFHGLANHMIAAVSQADGTINASFIYAPFGEVIEATNAGGSTDGIAAHPHRMNDKFVDEISELGYYGFRYYDKLSMTWTQSDPLYRFAPDLAKRGPRRANLYTFSLQNPLSYLDPDGRDSTTCREGGGGCTTTKTAETVADEGVSSQVPEAPPNAPVTVPYMSTSDKIVTVIAAAFACELCAIPLAAGLFSTSNDEGSALMAAGCSGAACASKMGGRAPGATSAESSGPASTAADVVYHYTTAKAAAGIQRSGLWSQSSATNVGTYSAAQASARLGVKGTPEVVVTIRNAGSFVPNKPAIVQPHPLGPGGGLDLTNPVRIGPECIVCVTPIKP